MDKTENTSATDRIRERLAHARHLAGDRAPVMVKGHVAEALCDVTDAAREAAEELYRLASWSDEQGFTDDGEKAQEMASAIDYALARLDEEPSP